MGDAAYDHLISLKLGGDPNDHRTLWASPLPGHKKSSGVNNAKDPLETKLHTAVCNGPAPLPPRTALTASRTGLCTTELTRLGMP
ncbi:hypothetical protein OHT77_31465 [Streptomyces sp. NBC_00252]|uniref:hypothetical protein n=1 Tax=Streptomyces sp. NBC_00252 TaxID=2975691 RepID=UPI002E2D806F|nr:hypothetical protein [Streptomyces sp. NBC_00252]